MTYAEMENLTYDELENFTYYELELGKLDLLLKTKGNIEIPDNIKNKLYELCYEALQSYDPIKIKDLNIPDTNSKYTIGQLLNFLNKVKEVAELFKLFSPLLKDIVEIINMLTS